MKKIRILPTVLFNDFSIVKGENFESWRIVGNLVQIVKIYSLREVDELIFFDISASKKNKKIDFRLVDEFADHCFMPLTVGGGVRSIEDIRKLLLCGADKVSINTAAISNPKLIKNSSNKFGNQCIVVAIDAKQINKNKWEIYSHGGRKRTGIDAVKWAKKMENLGAGEILLTSMDKDGTKSGFDLELTKKISNIVNIPVIASGGVGNIQHLIDGIKIGNASAVLAASIFHYGKYTLRQVKNKMRQKGIAVRI